MDKNYLIQLTNKIYELTLLFPKKEPLRYRMRQAATEILAEPNEKDLDVLDSFFEVALAQNWVSRQVVLAIKQEYDRLRVELGLLEPKEESYPVDRPVAIPEDDGLPQEPKVMKVAPDKKERILSFLKEKGRVQVWQTKQLFPEISKRTLRRYFESMTEEGVIERLGERNDTFYQLKVIEG